MSASITVSVNLGAFADGEQAYLYVVDADGRNVRRLTSHPAIDAHPAWSPNGKRIEMESQSNPLSYCTRPKALLKGKRS